MLGFLNIKTASNKVKKLNIVNYAGNSWLKIHLFHAFFMAHTLVLSEHKDMLLHGMTKSYL